MSLSIDWGQVWSKQGKKISGWLKIWGDLSKNKSSQLTVDLCTCYPIEFWKKILPQKSELPNLVFFCFSLWTEQQTPTPHRPLAVLLNSGLLLFPQFSFFPQYSFSLQFSSHIDLFSIPRAQITLFLQLAVQGLHLPELGWGGPAHQDGHQRGHRPGERKKN